MPQESGDSQAGNYRPATKKGFPRVLILLLPIIIGIALFLVNKTLTLDTHPSAIISKDIAAPIVSTSRSAPAPSPVVANSNLVQIHTVKGMVTLELFPEFAPNAVKQLRELIKRGYYDATFFEVQSGLGAVIRKLGPTAEKVLTADDSNALKSKRGTVGVGKFSDSQVYLDNLYIGFTPSPELEQYYTIIGKVVEGLVLLETTKPGSPQQVKTVQFVSNMDLASRSTQGGEMP